MLADHKADDRGPRPYIRHGIVLARLVFSKEGLLVRTSLNQCTCRPRRGPLFNRKLLKRHPKAKSYTGPVASRDKAMLLTTCGVESVDILYPRAPKQVIKRGKISDVDLHCTHDKRVDEIHITDVGMRVTNRSMMSHWRKTSNRRRHAAAILINRCRDRETTLNRRRPWMYLVPNMSVSTTQWNLGRLRLRNATPTRHTCTSSYSLHKSGGLSSRLRHQ